MDQHTHTTKPIQKKREISAAYERIALDIAKRIARGELEEGRKLSGRTLMSGEYGVSPETIRRSFALLEERNVVCVMHNSGVKVLSKEKATSFIEKYEKHDESKNILLRMKQLIKDHEMLDNEFFSLAKHLFSMNARFHESNPFSIYEYQIKEGSIAIDTSLSQLHFWQETGATVIAIRREGTIHLSPGPNLALKQDDILMMVGPHDLLTKTQSLLD